MKQMKVRSSCYVQQNNSNEFLLYQSSNIQFYLCYFWFYDDTKSCLVSFADDLCWKCKRRVIYTLVLDTTSIMLHTPVVLEVTNRRGDVKKTPGHLGSFEKNEKKTMLLFFRFVSVNSVNPPSPSPFPYFFSCFCE